MGSKQRYYCVLTLTLAVGCAYVSVNPGETHSGDQLAPTLRVWVLTPQDGVYGRRTYSGSGQAVASRTLTTVRRRFPLAQLAPDINEADALQRTEDVDLIVSPEILHWEDRATAWSGLRDKVQVEVRLLRVQPPELLSSVVFESRNNSITFLNRRPEDLLDDDFAKAVLDLF